MDQIVDEITCMNEGYRMGTHKINCICYADDATLIASSEDELQKLVYRFEQKSKQLNMKISSSKTKCMTASKHPIRCKIVVEGSPIEQVMSFVYLGTKISSWGNLHDEVHYQAMKAARISGCMRTAIWKSTVIDTKTKTHIYKTCVRPVLTYAAETRADTTTTKCMLRTTEMQTLRSITGYTRLDKIRSEAIREKCQMQDVVRWARNRRRLWNDHVGRMADNRLAKIVTVTLPPGKRGLGRPNKRWRDSWTSLSQEKSQ